MELKEAAACKIQTAAPTSCLALFQNVLYKGYTLKNLLSIVRFFHRLRTFCPSLTWHFSSPPPLTAHTLNTDNAPRRQQAAQPHNGEYPSSQTCALHVAIPHTVSTPLPSSVDPLQKPLRHTQNNQTLHLIVLHNTYFLQFHRHFLHAERQLVSRNPLLRNNNSRPHTC